MKDRLNLFFQLLRVTDGEPGCVALVEPGPGMS